MGLHETQNMQDTKARNELSRQVDARWRSPSPDAASVASCSSRTGSGTPPRLDPSTPPAPPPPCPSPMPRATTPMATGHPRGHTAAQRHRTAAHSRSTQLTVSRTKSKRRQSLSATHRTHRLRSSFSASTIVHYCNMLDGIGIHSFGFTHHPAEFGVPHCFSSAHLDTSEGEPSFLDG